MQSSYPYYYFLYALVFQGWDWASHHLSKDTQLQKKARGGRNPEGGGNTDGAAAPDQQHTNSPNGARYAGAHEPLAAIGNATGIT